MSNSNLHDDIAYMKSLAEAGNAGPLPNGATLLWAGIMYAAAAIAQYGLIVGWLPKTGWMSGAIWFGASTIFGIMAFGYGIARWRRKGQSIASRASNFAWSAVGFGIVFLLLTLTIIANRVPQPDGNANAIVFTIAPLILLMYGMGWWVSANVANQSWLKLVAMGCFLGAPAMGLLSGLPEQMLAYAVALILFAAVPGFLLMRAEKG